MEGGLATKNGRERRRDGEEEGLEENHAQSMIYSSFSVVPISYGGSLSGTSDLELLEQPFAKGGGSKFTQLFVFLSWCPSHALFLVALPVS